MRCPDCREELVILEVDEIELDMCMNGHGLWFDAQELEQLFAAAEVPADLSTEWSDAATQVGKRRCPRCNRRLLQVDLQGQGPVLDRCPAGHGFWVDPGELGALAAARWADDRPALRQVQEYLRNFFPESGAVARQECDA